MNPWSISASLLIVRPILYSFTYIFFVNSISSISYIGYSHILSFYLRIFFCQFHLIYFLYWLFSSIYFLFLISFSCHCSSFPILGPCPAVSEWYFSRSNCILDFAFVCFPFFCCYLSLFRLRVERYNLFQTVHYEQKHCDVVLRLHYNKLHIFKYIFFKIIKCIFFISNLSGS